MFSSICCHGSTTQKHLQISTYNAPPSATTFAAVFELLHFGEKTLGHKKARGKHPCLFIENQTFFYALKLANSCSTALGLDR